jgi:molybdate/tungstate transport system permease protein
MAGVFIYNQYISVGLPPAAASSAILIITGVIAMAILRLAGGKNAVVY